MFILIAGNLLSRARAVISNLKDILKPFNFLLEVGDFKSFFNHLDGENNEFRTGKRKSKEIFRSIIF